MKRNVQKKFIASILIGSMCLGSIYSNADINLKRVARGNEKETVGKEQQNANEQNNLNKNTTPTMLSTRMLNQVKPMGLKTENDYTIDDETGYITSYTGSDTNLDIPQTIGNVTVKGIKSQDEGKGVFQNKKITKVNLPNTIEYIGSYAFADNKITEINIPDSVTTIESNAFKAANDDSWGFSITKVTGMKGITELKDNSFANIERLEIDLPSVTSNEKISQSAFGGSRKKYVKIFTGNVDSPLKSKDNYYVVNPAVVYLRPVDDQTKMILKQDDKQLTKHYDALDKDDSGYYSIGYNGISNSADYYRLGGSTKEYNIETKVYGYLTPKKITKKSDKITELKTYLDFEYKKINLEANDEYLKTVETIKGKVTFGDKKTKMKKVTVNLIKNEASDFYSSTPAKIVISDELDNSTDEFELKIPQDFDYKYKEGYALEVVVEDDDYEVKGMYNSDFSRYEGYKTDIKFVDNLTVKVKEFKSLEKMVVEQGKQIDMPKTIKAKMTDGSENEYPLSPKGKQSIDTSKPGEFEYEFYIYKDKNFKEKFKETAKLKVIVKPAQKDPVNTEKLNEVLLVNSQLKSGVKTSTDGKDIDQNDTYVTQDELDAYVKARKEAQDLYNNARQKPTEYEQKAIDDMVTKYQTAVDTFKAALKKGNKIEEVKTADLSVTVKIEIDDIGKLDFKLKNTIDNSIIKPEANIEKNKSEKTYKYTFKNLKQGSYYIENNKKYISVDEQNKRKSKMANLVSIDPHAQKNFDKDYKFLKGNELTFDVGDDTKGEIEQGEDTVFYYLPGEEIHNVGDQYNGGPRIKAKRGFRFVGWSREKNSLIPLNEHETLNDEKILYAVYKIDDPNLIDEGTKIDDTWVLGDFTYEKRPLGKDVNGNDLGEGFVVTGFSKRGLHKHEKHYDISLPPTTDKGEVVVAIGANAFDKDTISDSNSYITSVTIPDSIKYIHHNAFYQQTQLKSVQIPKSVEIIGANSFLRCSLESVVMDDNVKKIGSGAFAENKISMVVVPKGVKKLEQSVFANNPLKNVILQEGLIEIDKRAFYQTFLTSVQIPESLEILHEDAFEEARGVTTYNGKVVLYPYEGKKVNPNLKKESKHHIVVENALNTNDIKARKEKFIEQLLKLQELKHSYFVSNDGYDVPKDEQFVDFELDSRVNDLIYKGYYVYYDDSVTIDGSPIVLNGKKITSKYKLKEIEDEIINIRSEIKSSLKTGLKETDIKHTIMLMIGIDGIEYKKDLEQMPTYKNLFVLKDTKNKESKKYNFTNIVDVVPNLAYLNYELPKGDYEVVAPVGLVAVYRDGTIGGDIKEEEVESVTVPQDSSKKREIGYSYEKGIVYIYDLMEKGSTDDTCYETRYAGNIPRKAPEVDADYGYRFVGWSLDGENVIELESLKNNRSNLILKAVYKKSSESQDTTKLDELIQKAENLLKDTWQSEDGSDIEKDKKYATQQQKKDLETAIQKAKDEKEKNKKSVKSIEKSLEKAIEKFEKSLQNGKKEKTQYADKEPLKNLLLESEKVRDETIISENGENIEVGKYYILKKYKDALYDAQVEAYYVLNDENTDTDHNKIQSAKDELEKAFELFKQNRKLKQGSSENNSKPNDGGGSSSTNNSPSHTGGGGGGGSSSSTKSNDNKQINTPPENKMSENKTKDSKNSLLDNAKTNIVFKDTKNHWASEYISKAVSRGLMVGISKDNFASNAPLTRAMVVTVLMRLSGDEIKNTTKQFKDIKVSNWYFNSVNWAAQNGIVGGIGNNKFAPNKNITRAQMAKIINNYLKYKNIKPDYKRKFKMYNDAKQIKQIYVEDIYEVTLYGIMIGDKNGNFNPNSNMTRAEMTVILDKLLEMEQKVK